jgi:hypothetical protein
MEWYWQGCIAGKARSHEEASSPKVELDATATFLRRVARLLCLAKRTAPDILLIFRYLDANRSHMIQHWTGGEVKVSAYIDASLASDKGSRERTGTILMCAGSMVGDSSAK